MTATLDHRDDARLCHQIEVAVAACLSACQALARKSRTKLPLPEIRFDLRGRSAGQFVWQRGRPPVLRFNVGIARRHRDDFLRTTVAHEVAHLVTASCHGRTAPHGREWRDVMRHLGIAQPARCHDYAVDETTVRQQRRWQYQCGCMQHELSTTRHRRVQQKLVEYRCRRCGSPLQPAGTSGHAGTLHDRG